jgi:hypothetical protein
MDRWPQFIESDLIIDKPNAYAVVYRFNLGPEGYFEVNAETRESRKVFTKNRRRMATQWLLRSANTRLGFVSELAYRHFEKVRLKHQSKLSIRVKPWNPWNKTA